MLKDMAIEYLQNIGRADNTVIEETKNWQIHPYDPFGVLPDKYFAIRVQGEEQDKYLVRLTDDNKNILAVFALPVSGLKPGHGLLVGEHLEIKEGDSLFDIGTGPIAYFAILSVRRGASYAIGAEINPASKSSSQNGIIFNRLEDKISIVHSDIFSAIGNRKFDIIVTNPPILPAPPKDKDVRDNARLAGYDEAGYNGRQFIDLIISQARSHLNQGGRLIIGQFEFLGVDKAFGDGKTTFELLREQGFEPRIVGSYEVPVTPIIEKRLDYIKEVYPRYNFVEKDSGLYHKFVVISATYNENLAIGQLERIARGEVSDERAEELINRLLQLGTERADVQRALLLYNRFKEKPIQGILKNYHLDGASVEFVPENDVDFIMDREGAVDNLFKGKKVMVIETHPDDAMINIGHITRRLISVAKEFALITAVPDQAGVTDEYAAEFDSSLMPPSIGHSNRNKVKRWIRAQEAKLGAQLLGIEGNRYVNLDLDFPLERPQYDNAGNLLSYESIFRAPTKEDIRKIEKFVKLHKDTDIYLLAFPFSNHPHHRAITNLFLNAIYKYNRKANVFFWEDDKEFGQHKIPQNLFYFFRKEDRETKKGNIRQAYISQDNRRGEGYYASRAEEIGLSNAEDGYVQLAQQGFYSAEEIRKIRKEMPYAERLLKVKIVEPPLADNEFLNASLNGSAVRICQ